MKRTEFVKTLELIKPALSTDNSIPIFQCFCFSGGNAIGYNDKIAIIGPVEYEGTAGIHGNTLLGILNASTSEEIDISLNKDSAVIKQGKSVTTLPFNPEENFIFNPPDEKWSNKIQITSSFMGALDLCLETVSVDETQLLLQGVSLKDKWMYSCNGDTLTRIEVKTGIKSQVLLPAAFCNAVARLWKSLEMTKGQLCFNDQWAYADFEDWGVYGRLLEIGDPLDFDALIKKTIKANTTPQNIPGMLNEALARARVLADPESQKTVVTVSKGKLQLFTGTHMGEIRDEMPLKGHPDVTANINPSYLQRAIEHCEALAIHENCIVLESPDVLMLISNME